MRSGPFFLAASVGALRVDASAASGVNAGGAPAWAGSSGVITRL
jgi:hypothetical protein